MSIFLIYFSWLCIPSINLGISAGAEAQEVVGILQIAHNREFQFTVLGGFRSWTTKIAGSAWSHN